MNPTTYIDRVLDGVEFLVKWAAGWAVGLIVLVTPFMIFGLQLDALGYRTASLVFLGAEAILLCIGLLLALTDFALRVKRNESVIILLRRALSNAATSRTAAALSPVAKVLHHFLTMFKALLSSILILGMRTVGILLLAIVGGFGIYSVFGLLGTAPWWAIVIIVLLVVNGRG
jgi:hypothetical protein